MRQRARLSTLEAFDRLGSGFAISARDLDLRGAGDLTADDQTGHMQMIGVALYHQLLDRAIRIARGERPAEASKPTLHGEESGFIPIDHVPDAVTRISLYARLARLQTTDEIEAFEDEIEDRFGSIPAPLNLLLVQARVLTLADKAQVRDVRIGPKAIALEFAPGQAEMPMDRLKPLFLNVSVKDDRIILAPAGDGADRYVLLDQALSVLSEDRQRPRSGPHE